MKEIVTPFGVGLLVLAGLASSVWMFGQVREGIEDDAAGYRVYAIFRDVSGLANKSRVVVAGINVGQIDQIELHGDKARVWVRVNIPLKSDARIAKRQASLLGEYYLQLTPGYTGEALGDGDEIVTVDYDVAPADLLNELKDIVVNVKDITETFRNVVAGPEGEQKLARMIDNVNEMVAEVNRAVLANGPKVDGAFDNAVAVTVEARAFAREFRADAKRILADAQAVTANVRAIIGEHKGDVAAGFEGVKGAVSRLQGALDKLDATLDSTSSIARKIDEGEGTIGRLVNDDRLHETVAELAEESSQFVRRITRLQTVVALRSEYYLGQTAVKNYLALRFQPKPDKYYELALVDDPRGNTAFRETVTQSSASGEEPVVSEQQTITEDRFRLTLQFAKRFYFVTGRIGIIENSGGLGLDVHLFDDDLELSTNLYAFSANVNPRFKVWAMYTFFTHLYIAAGIDEVLNDELTDVFVGAALRFTDDDLKAIFTAAPTPSL